MASQLGNITTETENKKLEELFLAVFFNDLEKVIEFKNQHPETYAKKNNFLIDDTVSFDLINLTFFNQTIWKGNGWIEELILLAKKNRERTRRMLDFWRTEYGHQNLLRNIEYNQYYEYFHCDDPKIYDEVSWEPMSNFLNKGFREIDLRLHNRAECFDFMETKKLLEQGANMNVFIYENELDSSILMRIEGEASYLGTCHVVPEFIAFENKGYDQEFDLKYMFGNLLGLAAHEDMSHLFSLYNHKDQ